MNDLRCANREALGAFGCMDKVIYEFHVGTLTPDGTLDAAIGELDGLKALGITLIELMPVAEFPGRWRMVA